jgi:TolB-like protein
VASYTHGKLWRPTIREDRVMIKKYYTFIVLLLSFIFIFFTSGCQTTPSKQTHSPGETLSASFPKMMVGDSWVTKEFSKKGIVTRNRTIIETKSDGSFVEEVKDDKRRTLNEYYNNRYQRVISINVEKGSAVKIPKPPEKRLEFPLFVGKKWNDEFDGWTRKGIRHFTNDYIVDKYETITTKAGSFKAFKIIRLGSIPEKSWKGKEEYWYSPEAKCIVRSIPDWRYGSELLSYKLALADRTLKVDKPKIIIRGERVKIGIIEFQSLNEEAKKDNLGKIVSEMLTTSFVNSEAFKIIEREQLQKVVREFQLSQSGIIDTSYAKQIGKIAGADAIVTGSVTKIGNDLRLDARIIDVESGIILTAEKSEGKVNLKSIGMMTDQIVAKLVNKFYKDKK